MQRVLLWLRENLLLGIGAFFILLSLGWFLTYIFINDWVGPQGRVGICFALSLAVYGLGYWMLPRDSRLGQTLLSLGVLGVLLSLSAGIIFYHLWPPVYPFVFMLTLLAVTGGIAFFHDLQGLATSVIIGAIAMPMFLDVNVAWTPLISMVYYLLVVAFGAAAALVKNWGWPLLFASWGAIGLFHHLLNDPMPHPDIEKAFLPVFQTVLLFPAFFAFVTTRRALTYPMAFSLFFSLSLVIIWEGFLTDPEMTAMLLSWVMAFIALGYYASQQTKLTRGQILSTWLMGTFAFLFIWRATNFLGPDYDLMAMFAAGLAAVLIGHSLFQSPRAARNLSWFFLVPLLLLLESWIVDPLPELNSPVLWLRFVAFGTTAAAAYVLIRGALSQNVNMILELRPAVLTVISGLIGLWFIWELCHAVIASPFVARAVALTIYTVIGEVLLFIGSRKAIPAVRYGGMIIIAGVVLQLVAVEIWHMPIVVRIVTFLAVGMLLLLTALADRRKG